MKRRGLLFRFTELLLLVGCVFSSSCDARNHRLENALEVVSKFYLCYTEINAKNLNGNVEASEILAIMDSHHRRMLDKHLAIVRFFPMARGSQELAIFYDGNLDIMIVLRSNGDIAILPIDKKETAGQS